VLRCVPQANTKLLLCGAKRKSQKLTKKKTFLIVINLRLITQKILNNKLKKIYNSFEIIRFFKLFDYNKKIVLTLFKKIK
jgi:hypothetical protein